MAAVKISVSLSFAETGTPELQELQNEALMAG
jgi:hypothetical protein